MPVRMKHFLPDLTFYEIFVDFYETIREERDLLYTVFTTYLNFWQIPGIME